jgi:hypothetical protein
MKKLFPILSILVCFSIMISSCNLPLGMSTSPDPGQDIVGTAAAQTVQALRSSPVPAQDSVGTAAAQTVQAMSTQIAQTGQPQKMPATFTVAPVVPTDTVAVVQPSDTPEPTLTNTITPVPPTATMGPLDKLGKVVDLTYADGTFVKPGTSFTKTWRLTNAGNTTWGPGYAVVFFSGDSMNSPASVPLTASVPPNGTMDISVALTSPSTSKSYTGYYKIRNASGALFGFGVNADQAFWVKITVGVPATSIVFSVTSVDISINKSSVSVFCPYPPYTFKWTAKITANKKGTVTYHWARSDGSNSSTETLKFTDAGTHSVSDTWDITAPSSGWERIYIEEPNHQSFSKVSYKMTCK